MKKFYKQIMAISLALSVILSNAGIQTMAENTQHAHTENNTVKEVNTISGSAIEVESKEQDLIVPDNPDQGVLEDIQQSEEFELKVDVDEESGCLVWYSDNDKDLTFTSNGDVSNITGIGVDGKVLSSSNFDVSQKHSDLIKYRLYKQYLSTLEEGYHEVKIEYNDTVDEIQLAVILHTEEINLLATDTIWQEDWEYELSLNNSAYGSNNVIVLGCYTGINTNIVIPSVAIVEGIEYRTVACSRLNSGTFSIFGIKDSYNYNGSYSVELEDNVIISSEYGFSNFSTAVSSITIGNVDISYVNSYREMFYTCSELLEIIGLMNLSTSSCTDTVRMFAYCSNIKSLDIEEFDMSNVYDANNMFAECNKLEGLNISKWDMSNVRYIYGMFNGCESITDIDTSNWNASNVSDYIDSYGGSNGVNDLFKNCKSLVSVDISGINTEGVTGFQGTFEGCESIVNLDLSSWNTDDSRNFNAMFSNCYKLKSVNMLGWNYAKSMSFYGMFNNCISIEELDLSMFTCNNMQDLSNAFNGCRNLKILKLFTINLTNEGIRNTGIVLRNTFSNCDELTDIDLSSWENITVQTLDGMIANSTKIIELDMSNFDFSTLNSCFCSMDTSSLHKLALGNVLQIQHEVWDTIYNKMYLYDSGTKRLTDEHNDVNNKDNMTLFYASADKHNMDRKVITPATYTSDGVAEDTCKDCGLILAVDLPKLTVPAGSYLVEFETNNDQEIEAQVVKSGNKVTEPTELAKDWKVLEGWYTNSSCTSQWNFNSPVTSNMTLYANWADKYTVSFNNDGSVITVDVIQGHTITEPIKPIKKGHEFKGWYKEQSYTNKWDFNSAVESDMILYAKFDKNIYTITFDTGNTQSVLYGDKITKPSNPTKKGHTFKGWFTDQDITIEWDFDNDVVEESITLYSKFDINTYDVTFDTGAGSSVSKQSVQYGNKVKKPTTLSNEGFVLKGWYKDSSYTEEWKFDSDIVEDDTMLYAKWVAGFNITLIDSVDDSIIDIIGVEDGDVADEPPIPEHDGYTFKGWYTAKDNDIKHNWGQSVTEHESVYAQWYKNPNITFVDYEDGSKISELSVGYGDTITLPESNLTKEDSEFLGYFKDNTSVSGSNIYNSGVVMTEDIIIYCLFAELRNYTVYGKDSGCIETDRVIAEDSLYVTTINGEESFLVKEQAGNGYEVLEYGEECIEVFNSGIDGDRKWVITEWLQDDTGTSANYRVTTGSAIDLIFVSDDNFPSSGEVYSTIGYQYKVVYSIDGETSDNWIDSGSTLLEPKIVLEEGREVEGWYIDSKFNNEWDFDIDVVTRPLTLYAKIVNADVQPTVPTMPSNPSTPTNTTEPLNAGSNGGGSTVVGGTGGTAPSPSTGPSTSQQTVKIKAVVDGEPYDVKVSVIDGKVSIVTPLKEGYSFDGWYSDIDLTDIVDVSKLNPYEDIVLYGRFIEDELPTELVKVSLIDSNGTELTCLTLKSGNSIESHVKDILSIEGLDISVDEYLLRWYNRTIEDFESWLVDDVEWDLTDSVFNSILLKPKFKASESTQDTIKMNKLIHLKSVNVGKKQIRLKWNTVEGANYYVVYGAKCGSNLEIIGLVITDGEQNVLKHRIKKLNKETWYKFKVVAYENNPLKSKTKKFILKKGVNPVAKSLVVHTVTTGGKYTNTKSVIVGHDQKNIVLSKGDSVEIVVITELDNKNKPTKYHCAKLRLKSDSNVVSVKNKTTIIAKKRGTCKVYAYAQNGKKKIIKVTVE